jgi:hypothetical protein
MLNAVNIATFGVGGAAFGAYLGVDAGGGDLLRQIVLGGVGAAALATNPFGVGPTAASYVYSNIVGGGGGARDMTPGSDFIKRLNNIPTYGCEWKSARVYVKVLWWGYWTTRWWQVCGMNNPANFAPIPNNVGVLELVGRNNNFDDFSSQMQPMRHGFATVMSVMAIGYWANTFLFQWWYAAPAAAATYVAITLWDLPSVWSREVMGSWSGDGVVPESSQKYVSTSGAIGGNPINRRFDNVDEAQHIGPKAIWKQPLVANFIRQFMSRLSVE